MHQTKRFIIAAVGILQIPIVKAMEVADGQAGAPAGDDELEGGSPKTHKRRNRSGSDPTGLQ